MAAGNPAAIGTRLQDPAWLNARRSQGSVIMLGMEKGKPALIVVEPIRRDNRIAGWSDWPRLRPRRRRPHDRRTIWLVTSPW